MALIAIASDKGAPGVTTAALALAAVWPRPVLLAECDPAGGDLVYRFPAVGGGHLDPRRGILSLAVVARRGVQPHQVWEHAQKLHGGLDVLAGVTNAEQGAGLSLLWGPIGKVLASLPQADVIADCGRLGADGPLYDLLAEATTVVLVTKVHVADVIRLRDRAVAFAAAAQSRGRRGFGVGVVVIADHKKFRAALGEVQQVLGQANAPAAVLGGIAHDPKGAELLSGEWGGNLDRTLLIKTAREVAQHLLYGLPPIANPAAPRPANPPAPIPQTPIAQTPIAPTPTPQTPIAPTPTPIRRVAPSAAPPFATAPPSAAVPAPAAQPSAAPPSTTTPPSTTPPSTTPPSTTPPSAAQPLTTGQAAERLPAGGRSTGGPRAAFSRVLGARSGRHQADSGQAAYVSAPVPGAQAQARSTARHAQGPTAPARPAAPADAGSVYSRPPMPPLAPAGSDASAPPPPDFGQADPGQADPGQASLSQSRPAHPDPSSSTAQSDPLWSGPAQASWAQEPADLPEPASPADGPAPPGQEDYDWGSSRWQRSPGPMGSSRPGGG